MTIQTVDCPALTLVGIDFQGAFERPYLILPAWIALAPRLAEVKGQVEPHILYGAWHREPEAETGAYLVGVQVAGLQDVPVGMAALTIPAGRYAMAVHQGSMGDVAATHDALLRWMKEAGAQRRDAPTFEVYDTRQAIDDAYAVLIYEPIV